MFSLKSIFCYENTYKENLLWKKMPEVTAEINLYRTQGEATLVDLTTLNDSRSCSEQKPVCRLIDAVPVVQNFMKFYGIESAYLRSILPDSSPDFRKVDDLVLSAFGSELRKQGLDVKVVQNEPYF